MHHIYFLLSSTEVTLDFPYFEQAFTAEVGAVERGLHIQLGQPGAKTEAQLGDQQLEAAKRLRHMLATNRWVFALAIVPSRTAYRRSPRS